MLMQALSPEAVEAVAAKLLRAATAIPAPRRQWRSNDRIAQAFAQSRGVRTSVRSSSRSVRRSYRAM